MVHSSWREERDDAHGAVGIVKITPEVIEISGVDREERWLTRRCGAASVKIKKQAGQGQHQSNHNQPATSHIHPARSSAMACGRRIETNTMTAEHQSSTVLSRLGRQLHCLAHATCFNNIASVSVFRKNSK